MPYPKNTFPSLSRLYHGNSRLTSARPFYISPIAEKAMSGAYAHFPGRPAVSAPEQTACSGYLDAIFDKRTSTRQFAGHLDLQRLSDVIVRATRINRAYDREELLVANRVYPSPGGLYPVELYVLPIAVSGLKNAVYHWDVVEQCFEQLWDAPVFDMNSAIPGIQPPTDVPAAMIAMSVYFPRIEWKYGERSYRFALMEAASIATNLQLVCADENVAARWVGGFQDEWWDDALHLDGDQETTVLTFALG